MLSLEWKRKDGLTFEMSDFLFFLVNWICSSKSCIFLLGEPSNQGSSTSAMSSNTNFGF